MKKIIGDIVLIVGLGAVGWAVEAAKPGTIAKARSTVALFLLPNLPHAIDKDHCGSSGCYDPETGQRIDDVTGELIPTEKDEACWEEAKTSLPDDAALAEIRNARQDCLDGKSKAPTRRRLADGSVMEIVPVSNVPAVVKRGCRNVADFATVRFELKGSQIDAAYHECVESVRLNQLDIPILNALPNDENSLQYHQELEDLLTWQSGYRIIK